jgi:hypothetical protein
VDLDADERERGRENEIQGKKEEDEIGAWGERIKKRKEEGKKKKKEGKKLEKMNYLNF